MSNDKQDKAGTVLADAAKAPAEPVVVTATPEPAKAPASEPADPVPAGIAKVLETAPADMFAKSNTAPSRPERVAICQAHIDAFASTIIAGQTDISAVQTATLGMSKAMNLLETLNASDVEKVLDHMVASIIDTTRAGGKAYDKFYVFSGRDAIASITEREHFVRMLNLVTAYAKLHDKSKLSTKVSVAYSLEFVKSDAGRKAITAFFG